MLRTHQHAALEKISTCMLSSPQQHHMSTRSKEQRHGHAARTVIASSRLLFVHITTRQPHQSHPPTITLVDDIYNITIQRTRKMTKTLPLIASSTTTRNTLLIHSKSKYLKQSYSLLFTLLPSTWGCTAHREAHILCTYA
jgi:hypothetical protein